MTPRGKEENHHDRFDGQITLRTVASAGLGTIEMETANLSVGGAHCLSDRAIPPMTRLQLNIFLPSRDGRTGTLHYPIQVTAVVVRSELIHGDGTSAAPDGAVFLPVPATHTILPGNERRRGTDAVRNTNPEIFAMAADDSGPDRESLAAVDGQAEDLIAANTADSGALQDAVAAAGAGAHAGPQYRLALFFADIAASDRELLSRYLGETVSS